MVTFFIPIRLDVLELGVGTTVEVDFQLIHDQYLVHPVRRLYDHLHLLDHFSDTQWSSSLRTHSSLSILKLMIEILNMVIIVDSMIYLGLIERETMILMKKTKRWKSSLNISQNFVKTKTSKKSWTFS